MQRTANKTALRLRWVDMTAPTMALRRAEKTALRLRLVDMMAQIMMMVENSAPTRVHLTLRESN